MLAAALAAVLLYFSVRGVEWARVWRTIASADWRYVAGAAGFTMFSFLLRALRWRILLNAEARFSVGTVFWANSAGYLGNSFLPARAGEVIRSLVISSRSTLSKTYVLTTALGERVMDAIALVLWSSLALLGVNPKPQWMADVSRSMAVLAGAGAVAVTVLPHTGGLLQGILKRVPLPERARAVALGLADQVLEGLRAFHNWGRFAGFVGLTVVIWTSDSFGTIIGARALGITLSFRVAMLLLAALGLSSALPSTPGYVGIYQFVAVTVLTPFGVSKDGALAYILVLQAIAYAVVVLFGLPAVYQLRKRRRAADRALDARNG